LKWLNIKVQPHKDKHASLEKRERERERERENKTNQADDPPHVHPMEETLQLLVRSQAMDCLQVMEPEHHLVVHMNDQQKESLYLGLTLGFYKVGAANSSCNLHSKLNSLFATMPKFTDVIHDN
jgi:hypothetical protein